MKDKPECITYANGTKYWYLNGKLHRTDGPAVEYSDGSTEWWLNDKPYTKDNYYQELYKRGIISKEEYFVEML